jgi:hypothetical protein
VPANTVHGYLPSTHGLRFPNAFPPGPTLTFGGLDPRSLGFGDAAAGLCGGMVLTSRDLFEAGLEAPAGLEPPADGSSRFRALVRRQVESLDWLRVPLRSYDLQAFRPDPPGGVAALLRREPPRVESVLREWPRIRAEIDGGHPAVVGIVRTTGFSPWALARNHQVLAYAYDVTSAGVTIRVYDPNHPGRDDVELRVDLAADPALPWRDRVRLAQSTDEPLLGFFRQRYPSARSVRAWR